MRSLLFFSAFTFSAFAVAADSNTFQLRDAGDLVRVCSVPADDTHHANAMGFCHGILVGAYRYYDSVTPTAKRFVCAPNPIPTRNKVMTDFVAWGNSHPGNMKDPPIDTLFRYLEQTYPCKK
jgi:hypothetical protein